MNRVTPSASSVHRVANDFIHPRKAPNHRNVRLLTTLFLSVVTLGTLPLFAYLVTKLLAKRVSKQTSSASAAKVSNVADKQLPKQPTLREQVLKDVEKLNTFKKDIQRAVEKGQLPEDINNETIAYYRKFLDVDLKKQDPAAWAIFLSYYDQKGQAKLVKESGLQDHPLIQFIMAVTETGSTQNLNKEGLQIIQRHLNAFLDLNISHPSMREAFKFLCKGEKKPDEKKRLAEVYAKRWIDYIEQRSVEDLDLWGLTDERQFFDRYRTHPGFECYQRGVYDINTLGLARDTHQFPQAYAELDNHGMAAQLGDTNAMVQIVNNKFTDNETRRAWARKIIETGTARDLRQILPFAMESDLKDAYLKKGAELKEPVLTAIYAATLGPEDQENATALLQKAMVKDDYKNYLAAVQYLHRNNHHAQLDTLLQAGYEKGHLAAYRLMIQVCYLRNKSDSSQIKFLIEKIAKKTHLYQLAIYLAGNEYKHARESGFDLCMIQGDAIVRRKLIQIAKDKKEDALREKVLGHILQVADFDEMVDLLRQDDSLKSRFAGKIDECAPSAAEKGCTKAISYLLDKAVRESNVSLAEERAKRLAETGDLEEIGRILGVFNALEEEPLKKVLPHLLNAFYPSADVEKAKAIIGWFILGSRSPYIDTFRNALKKVENLEVLANATAKLENKTDSKQEELRALIVSKCEHESQEFLDRLADPISNIEIAGIVKTAKMSAEEAFAKIDPSNANLMDNEYRWGAALKGHREALHQIYRSFWDDKKRNFFVDRFASKLVNGCSAQDAYRYSKEDSLSLGQLYLSHAAAQGHRKAINKLVVDYRRGVEFAKKYPELVPISFVERMRANKMDKKTLEPFKDTPSLNETLKSVKSKYRSDQVGAITEFTDYVKKLSPADAYEQVSMISSFDDCECGNQLTKALYEHALSNNYYPAILKRIDDLPHDEALTLLKQKWASAPPLMQLKMAIVVVKRHPDLTSTAKVVELGKGSDDVKILMGCMRYFIAINSASEAEAYASKAFEKTGNESLKWKISNSMAELFKGDSKKEIPWLEKLISVSADHRPTKIRLLEAYHQTNETKKRDALIPGVIYGCFTKFWDPHLGLSQPVIEACVAWLRSQAKSGDPQATPLLYDYEHK